MSTATKRFRIRGGLSAKFKWGVAKTGKWKVQSISDAKSSRGSMPLDFLPFEVLDLVYGHQSFDDEPELLRTLEALS